MAARLRVIVSWVLAHGSYKQRIIEQKQHKVLGAFGQLSHMSISKITETAKAVLMEEINKEQADVSLSHDAQ